MGWFSKKSKEDEGKLPPLPSLNPVNFDELDSLSEAKKGLPKLPGIEQEERKIKSKLSDVELEETMPSPPITSQIEKRQIIQKQMTKKNEPVFVRLDKFQTTVDTFEEIKEKVSEIEEVLKKIREERSKEEKELTEWENELNLMKARIEVIDKNMFSLLE